MNARGWTYSIPEPPPHHRGEFAQRLEVALRLDVQIDRQHQTKIVQVATWRTFTKAGTEYDCYASTQRN